MPKTMLRDVLELGINSNASDWHIKQNAPVTLRIEGDLVDTDFMTDTAFLDKLIGQMLNEDMLARLDSKGDADLSFVEDGIGRFRVNVHRQRGALAMAMRHVKTDILGLGQLGMPAQVGRIAEAARGIIIISGTTGSGKSTTLASMIEHINQTRRRHIVTIEDPIEYEFKDKRSIIEQREVGLDTESFYSALVHVLRQDPDIIMIGEMRDKESFDAALQASDTGHLVMTTLHSTSASQAVTRILDFYEHAEQAAIRGALAINLQAIICQRLMPRAFGGGVIPACEIMMNSPMIRKLLEQGKLEKLGVAIENGREDGMQSFNQSMLQLVNDGHISEEDALAMASNPEALKMALKGIILDSKSQILGD